VCGINLIMKCRMCHAPKKRKRVGVVQDSLVFPERLAALKSLREGVLEFGVGENQPVLVDVLG
jgi:hypothetical protein